jgi:hypothetical protein
MPCPEGSSAPYSIHNPSLADHALFVIRYRQYTPAREEVMPNPPTGHEQDNERALDERTHSDTTPAREPPDDPNNIALQDAASYVQGQLGEMG